MADEKIVPAFCIGESAPDFSAKTGDGTTVSLSEYAGSKNVVLYFYPRDDTPGCTREACSFRDNLERLNDTGTVVIGVSVDSEKSHRFFREKYDLNFDLLSDANHEIITKYGVQRTGKTGTSASRVTFLIDKNGIVRHIWAPVKVEGHTEQVLAKIRELEL